MRVTPAKITLDQWDVRYAALTGAGLREPAYGGPLRRHVADGDRRLLALQFDNSEAALRLWNLLLTEEDRLHQARARGWKIVGAMKDLGTVPVIANAFPHMAAFYPDGAWWLPCILEESAGLLQSADSLGVDDTFCPVRAMLGAFVQGNRFPLPDLLICSAGATCDDFSAIAQRLDSLGHPVFWWEIPHRRKPAPHETAVPLPGGGTAPEMLVAMVREELSRVRQALERLAGYGLDKAALSRSIRAANAVRRQLDDLRRTVYCAGKCPLPALEMLIAEMLAIHYCSDRAETAAVLDDLLRETERRVAANEGVLTEDAVRVFWVNPVADLRVMNLLEECGGRVCGTEYLFSHALDAIPEDIPPMEALARTALADPMAGPAEDRAKRVCADIRRFGAEALAISRIPGASHCATEGEIIREQVQSALNIPAIEIEVPPLCDAILPSLRTRIEALVEMVKERRRT